ncbi:MAG: hypothetical protein H7Y88_07500 [Phycisphaerales bacterium]|nr:hypothetical protein [Phycisphaerales bacterium]
MAVLLSLSQTVAQEAVRPVDLGIIPDYEGTVSAELSGDGKTVTGWCVRGGGVMAFRWNGGAISGLGELPDGTGSEGTAVSADGLEIAGNGTGSTPQSSGAFLWTSTTGLQSLGLPSGGQGTSAQGISADGSTVVGMLMLNNSQRAFRWRNGNFQDLGFLPDGTFSWALGASADGSVVVGYADSSLLWKAFRWTDAGMVDLAVPPGDGTLATAISDDGNIVIGRAVDHVFRWSTTGGSQTLAIPDDIDIDEVTMSSFPVMSGDGNIVAVTYQRLDGSVDHLPMLWKSNIGMVHLPWYLNQLGVDLSGWEIHEITGLSYNGDVMTGYGLYGGLLRSFVLDLCADRDQDSLCDLWEVNGIPYGGLDVDGELKMYLLAGASTLRKDIYVEVDAMPGRSPIPAAIDAVKTAFDTSTVPAVPGLVGGLPGIELHVDIDESTLPLRPYPNAFADFQVDKADFFGTASERSPADSAEILGAKRLAYRYCIFADSYAGTSSSGLAEPGGNDCMVTLGLWTPAGGTQDHQAGTFMHEFGHTLGLHHGGDDTINFKPNYYSVMNYLWQTPSSYGPSAPNGRFLLRYSNASLPPMVESVLDETVGIGGNFGRQLVPFTAPSTGWVCGRPFSSLLCINYAQFSGPVDWNNDGQYSSGATANVNSFDPTGTPPSQTLNSNNDWADLEYNFRKSPWFANGAIPTDLPDEMDWEMHVLLNSLPPPPCIADWNMNGVVGSSDITAFQASWFADLANGTTYADVNYNGVVTSADMTTFLNAWFDAVNNHGGMCP